MKRWHHELTSICDQYAHYAYQFDGQGNVTSVDNAGTPNVPHVVLNSQYDTLGNRTSLSATIAGTKDFFNSYAYDALSQLLSVTQMGQTGSNAVAPKGVGFSYNLDGQFTSALRFDPTTASPHPDIALGTFSYDTAGRLASLNYTHLGNPIDSFGYQYDPLDRVSQFSSIDGTATYGYDKTSQLTSVVYSSSVAPPTVNHQPANESFQYDANGNQTGPSPAGPNFTVGTDNLLSSDGTFNLFYDAEGNLIEKKRISTAPANDYDTKQTWDYRNRLTDVFQYNNSGVLTKHEHLVYDPFDRLIGRFIDSTGSGTFDHTELYVYDGTDVVLQFDGTGSLTNRYLNGPSPSGADQVYAEEDVTSLTSQGTVTYPLTDQQGSPRDIVDSNSVLDDHIIFSAFGQTAFESNPSVHHLEGFAGGLPDPVTGTVKFLHRDLSVVDRVFTSQDPWDFGGGDTNLNRYVGNGPTNGTDPTGLYNRSGHFWTVYIVAIAAGKSRGSAYRLAYYAQLPDQVKDFDAKTQREKIFNPLNATGWCVDVYSWLHSLHGGNRDDIIARRKLLQHAIKGAAGKLTDWERGFLIHALGDAYAHTFHRNGTMVAYGYPDGHWMQIMPGSGGAPDTIADRPELWRAYVRYLFKALANDGEKNPNAPDDALLQKLLDLGDDLPTNETEATTMMMLLARQAGYTDKYQPTDDFNIDVGMYTPKHDEVQAFIDKMKAFCQKQEKPE